MFHSLVASRAGVPLRKGQVSRNLYVDTDTRTWGKVVLHYGDDRNSRILTQSDEDYFLPRLAPTGDKFLCKDSRAHILVFDTLGSLIADLGKGVSTCWSADGEKIAFAEAKWGHYDLISSDIYVARYDGSERRQATNTSDANELHASFSPTSNYLLYEDDNSGAIHVVEL